MIVFNVTLVFRVIVIIIIVVHQLEITTYGCGRFRRHLFLNKNSISTKKYHYYTDINLYSTLYCSLCYILIFFPHKTCTEQHKRIALYYILRVGLLFFSFPSKIFHGTRLNFNSKMKKKQQYIFAY